MVFVFAVQLLSRVRLFAAPQTVTCQASLSSTVSQSLLKKWLCIHSGVLGWLSGKEYACQCRRCRFEKIHWRREWQPSPVFSPGKPHRQRTLVGCSTEGCRVEHDLASNTHTHTHTYMHTHSAHTCTYIHAHACACTHTHTRACARTHTHTHTHTPWNIY